MNHKLDRQSKEYTTLDESMVSFRKNYTAEAERKMNNRVAGKIRAKKIVSLNRTDDKVARPIQQTPTLTIVKEETKPKAKATTGHTHTVDFHQDDMKLGSFKVNAADEHDALAKASHDADKEWDMVGEPGSIQRQIMHKVLRGEVEHHKKLGKTEFHWTDDHPGLFDANYAMKAVIKSHGKPEVSKDNNNEDA